MASLQAFLAEGRRLDGTPLALAVDGGSRSDRVGYAFAAGIRAALEALAPDVARARVPALCASETQGAHPRNITTRFDESGGTVTGEKRFATLAPVADVLLVLAKTGEHEGRNLLRIVLVDPRAHGVRIEPMADLPFVPEIPHALVAFEAAPVSGVLEGDGYERYVKPFRTIEDVHVTAAMLAYVVVEARARGWARSVAEDAMGAIAALRTIAELPPLDPAAHVALAGALRASGAVFEAVDRCFAEGPGDDAARRWVRDRPLGAVADRARGLRLEAAWRNLGIAG